MYGMTPWKDEVVQYPYRYKETQNSDGTVEHEPSPGSIMQEGTPQSATNFNHMENGIHDVHVAMLRREKRRLTSGWITTTLSFRQRPAPLP